MHTHDNISDHYQRHSSLGPISAGGRKKKEEIMKFGNSVEITDTSDYKASFRSEKTNLTFDLQRSSKKKRYTDRSKEKGLVFMNEGGQDRQVALS